MNDKKDFLCELMGIPITDLPSDYIKKMIKNRGFQQYKKVRFYLPENTMHEFADSLKSRKCSICLWNGIYVPVIGKTLTNRIDHEVVIGNVDDPDM